MALVLLVDDEPDHLELADGYLTKAGHEVVTAVDAEEAWAYVRVFGAPDVGVFDVQMPGYSGFQLAESIKEDGRIEQFPVVFLTSSIHPLDVAKGTSLGDAYVDKADARTKLLAALDQVMVEAA